jgi:hypothetical protein
MVIGQQSSVIHDLWFVVGLVLSLESLLAAPQAMHRKELSWVNILLLFMISGFL